MLLPPPVQDKELSEHSHLQTKPNWSAKPSKITQMVFAACIKCEFLAFPSNIVVLEFLNINEVWFLSVILSNEAQNNTSQISVTGKIFVV